MLKKIARHYCGAARSGHGDVGGASPLLCWAMLQAVLDDIVAVDILCKMQGLCIHLQFIPDICLLILKRQFSISLHAEELICAL